MPQPLLTRLRAGHPSLSGQQARAWLLVLLAVLGSAAQALAQTVTIGSTTLPVASPATSSYYFGPIYRSSATSVFNYSRYAHLYTAAELGIPSGATITQLEWLKSDAGAVTGANTLNVLLSNSAAATLTDGSTWGTLSAGATSVYANAAQDVTGAAGTYLTVPTTGFTYTGGNLLVLTDWTKGGTATGAVNFVTNPAAGLALGAANSSALTSTTALTVATYGDRRPTLRITYVPGAPCTAPPTAGTAVASATSVCAGNTVSLSLSGTTIGSGLTFQWQSSTTGATGSYTNIAGATSSGYTTPVLTQTTYYRAIVTCSGQSATSSAVQVTVLAPTYATLPYNQGFENAWISRCNTNEVPDASWLNTPATGNNSWRRDDDGASANWTLPTGGAFTPAGSQGSSHAARFHSYYAANGTVGSFDLYANLSAAGSKRLTFDYVNVSTDGSKLDVLLSTDGGVTFSTTPLLTLTTVTSFTTQTLDLTATSATAVIRFQATSDYGSYDIGVDNVQLRLLAAVDLAATALATPPSTQTCYGSAEAIAVTVTNQGSAALNFATNPAAITVVVTTPGGPQTLTGSITTGTLAAGASQTVTLTMPLNMSAVGTYSFAITATVVGDGNTSNDLLAPAPTRTVAAPVAGTLSPASTALCISGTTTLTLAGAANGSIQFQSSTNGTTFTDIAGATSASYTTPVLNATTYYRAQVRCNTGTATSNVSTVTVNNPLVATTNTPLSICGGSTATLTATASAGSQVRFFSTATGGTALTSTTAGSYTTPALTANTTYYAEAYTSGPETVGRTAPTVTTGYLGVDTGLIFTTTAGLTIQSAVIYPVGTGTITFALRNSADVELAVTPAIAVTGSGASTPVTVPLNLQVPAAGTDYRLVVKAYTGITDLLRENPLPAGFSYPVTSPSGAFSITNGINSTPLAAYYYFYNIVLSSGQCASATRTPIQVNVTQPAVATFSYPTTGGTCAGSTGTVTPTLATGATAGTFTVSPATGLTINATTGVVNLATATAGTYTVTNTLPASGVCGVRTATATITVNPTPARPTITPSYNGTQTTLTSSAATGNQFYFNGVAIPGATGQTYVVNGAPTTYGSYTVVVTNSFGCSSQASVAQTVTSAKGSIAGARIELFPNPTPDGRVTLALSGFRSVTQLAVLDALGRVVRTDTLPATAGVVTHALDLSRLASGVYVLRLSNADGVETRRLTRE